MKLFYLTLIFCCIRLNMIQATSPSHISSETPPSAILAKSFALAADCSGINLDLGTSGPFSFGAGSYVVRASGADTTASFSFDLWDETTSNCVAAGGVNDITFDFKVLETFDAYSGSTMAGYVGASHKIVQDATGLKGTNPHGSSGATVSSTGDVRAYEVTVRFASHIEVLAGDLTVATTSINTAGKAYESAAIVFLDENGDPLDGGDPNYIGFYGANGPAINGTCTPPAATPSPWQGVSLPAQGSYFAQSTGTVDLSVDGCNPSSGSNGSGNNADVLASDVNLATTERIGGFKFMVYLEMVAVASADGISAGVTTSFTSTVNDLIIDNFNFVAPLPVTLSNFSAEATNKDEVQLEWTTEREIDNDYFLLERSENGKDFEKVTQVEGFGNSVVSQYYQYLDQTLSEGSYYYRLTQVDFSGAENYSDVVHVELQSSQKLSIYPSHTRRHLQIEFRKPLDKSTTLEVVDMVGQIKQTAKLEKGTLKSQMNVQMLPSGMYHLLYNQRGETQYQRFIKL